jgi:hypothetical protein
MNSDTLCPGKATLMVARRNTLPAIAIQWQPVRGKLGAFEPAVGVATDALTRPWPYVTGGRAKPSACARFCPVIDGKPGVGSHNDFPAVKRAT